MSDIYRKFYPIGFMLKSHETEADFVSFFGFLNRISELEGLNLNPQWMAIDACKASAKAIKKMYQSDVLLSSKI